MIKIARILAGCLALCLLLAPAAEAGPITERIQKEKRLVVGTSGQYPPLTATAKDGKLIGFDIDLARALARMMGVELKLVKMPLKKLLSALDSGELDLVISGMTMTVPRNFKAQFVGPYFVSGQTLLATPEVGKGIKSLADVNRPGFKLAVAKGSTGQSAARELMPKAQIISADTLNDALQMVLSGSAQAMVADFPFCAVAIFKNQDVKLGTLEKAFTFEPLGIAVPTSDPLLANLVQNYLVYLEGSGKLDYLRDRWFKNPGWINLLP